MQSRKLPELRWTKELSRSFWNDLAGSEYLERIAFSKFAAPFLVDLVAPLLRPDAVVFDFGGGDNLFLVREFLGRGFAVSCYEPNSRVQERNADLASNPRFLGAVPSLGNDAYDCVTLSEVIEHLDDLELQSTLESIRAGLKTGALLVVTTPEAEDLFTASRYCPTCRQLFHPWGHVRSFTADSLEQWLKDGGFDCEAIHSVDFSNARQTIEDAHAVREAARRLGETLGALPPGVLEGLSPADREDFDNTLQRMKALGEQTVQDDPKRRRYGFGGTLVAFARKR